MQQGTERGDFFDKVLKSGVVDEEKFQEGKEKGMTIREMESNAAALVSGGSETIATLLSGTCFQLLCNPQIMEKVVSEVHSAFQTEADITIDSANNLSYLINVLSEAMRI